MLCVSSALRFFPNLLWVMLTLCLVGIQTASVNITIDDHDSRIIYSNDWVHSSGKGYFNETISLSKTEGSNASYTFNGTQIYVFGTQFASETLSDHIISTYRIDNGTTIESYYTNPGSNDSILHQQLLFSSEHLSSTEHVLTITNANNISGLGLDFLVVTTTPVISPNESSTRTTIQSSGTSITFAVVNKPKFITLSSIIGLSFGGLALVLITFFGGLYYISYRRDPQRDTPQSIYLRDINAARTINSLETALMGLPKRNSGGRQNPAISESLKQWCMKVAS